MTDMVTFRITAVAEVRGKAARDVAEQLLETTARDLQLKLMLLSDALASVEIAFTVNRVEKKRTLTGDSLPAFLLKE